MRDEPSKGSRVSGPAPNVIAGLLTADGLGGINLTYDQNCGGAPTSAAGLFGTYSVESNGRAAIRAGTEYVVAYMVGANEAFVIVPDSTVLSPGSESHKRQERLLIAL